MARVRALLRRGQAATRQPAQLRFQDVEVDFRRYAAKRKGKVIDMTRKEFATLRFLASRSGEVVTRDELLNEVWGYETYPISRTVDNHIAALRAKLESVPSRPRHIQTVHGVGYKFVP
jgi:DNA-binding response OmpR family regulator